MADRRVTGSGKDRDGDITQLCNKGDWGTTAKAVAIQQIESGTHRYYVHQPGTTRVEVRVVNGTSGKYLRSTSDRTSSNNLDNLPNC